MPYFLTELQGQEVLEGLFLIEFGSHGCVQIDGLALGPHVDLFIILQVVLIQTFKTVEQDMTLLLVFLVPEFAFELSLDDQAFSDRVEFLLTAPLELSVRKPFVEEFFVLFHSVMTEELQKVLPDDELCLLKARSLLGTHEVHLVEIELLVLISHESIQIVLDIGWSHLLNRGFLDLRLGLVHDSTFFLLGPLSFEVFQCRETSELPLFVDRQLWIGERGPLRHVKLRHPHAAPVFELLEPPHGTVDALDSLLDALVDLVFPAKDGVDAPLAAVCRASTGAEFLHAPTAHVSGSSLLGGT